MVDPVLMKLVWGTGGRKALTSLFAFIAAMCGAVAGVPPAWTALGLPEAASKFYVHETVHKYLAPIEEDSKKIHTAQDNTTNSINRLYKSQLELYRSQIQGQLFNAQRDPAAATSLTVQERIADLQNQLAEVTRKIDRQ